MTSFSQYKSGRGNDRQRALSLWSGAPITINRKNPKLHIPKPFVCFLGGMQPAVLIDLRGEMSERDGFIHRFLYAYILIRYPCAARTMSYPAECEWHGARPVRH